MIELANQYKLDFVGLSFVRTSENVMDQEIKSEKIEP